MSGRTARAERVGATRELILTTAERLFAEHGLFAVSNRQVSEAAGQGNNAAVGYHFGTKGDLVRAIVRRHSGAVEDLRLRMVEATGDSTDVRDWVACLVHPTAEHLDALGTPTWFARFGAQAMTDPGFRPIMVEEALSAPSLHQVMAGLNGCLPELPADVREERYHMARQLLVHMFAERERALDEGTATPRGSWREAATGLVDAITGMWLAPVTPAAAQR
ncbi:TetR/AcrR family transcriptional regulator [Saccharopolyspora erythraea]|uniref:TetR/AcrR family transcriptional regulator n=1 Tax=Saccharopolyspora erythraea TaxID=1836 RepID=UPI001BAD80CC|nr:TetR/AcrR family transcriptional regulator [Saccharopolyspora erythraea]QUH03504.1 TetR/AcrR family transcriptional regulator [Saccharopolyspora erythraea]